MAGLAGSLPCESPRSSPLDGRVVAVAPLAPGAVVEPHIVIAQELQREQAVRRTDACLSVGDDLLVRRDAERLQLRLQGLGWLEALPLLPVDAVAPLQV